MRNVSWPWDIGQLVTPTILKAHYKEMGEASKASPLPPRHLGKNNSIPMDSKYMGVSWNRGYPQLSSIFVAFSLINHPGIRVPPWLWKPIIIHYHPLLIIINHILTQRSRRPFFAAGIAVPALSWSMPASTSWARRLTRRGLSRTSGVKSVVMGYHCLDQVY